MNTIEDKFSHPVYRPMWLKFKTPEVISLDNQIKQWIYCGITGAIILGDARSGKTTAAEILQNQYKSRINQKTIPGHLYSISKLDKKTIGNCIRGLYASTGAKTTLSHYASDKYFYQVLNFFTDLATFNDESMVILFADEFQRLSIDQVEVFADLQNHLRERGVTLLIYFIGNLAESSTTLETIENERYDHLRGRFFTQQYYFNGIHTLSQVKACLAYYDTTRYPENDGPTFTEFFLPKDFAKGWRLESTAKLMWSIYNRYKFRATASWGMKYFIGTVNPLLTDYLPKYGTDKIDSDMIKRCIEASGLIPQIVKFSAL